MVLTRSSPIFQALTSPNFFDCSPNGDYSYSATLGGRANLSTVTNWA